MATTTRAWMRTKQKQRNNDTTVSCRLVLLSTICQKFSSTSLMGAQRTEIELIKSRIIDFNEKFTLAISFAIVFRPNCMGLFPRLCCAPAVLVYVCAVSCNHIARYKNENGKTEANVWSLFSSVRFRLFFSCTHDFWMQTNEKWIEANERSNSNWLKKHEEKWNRKKLMDSFSFFYLIIVVINCIWGADLWLAHPYLLNVRPFRLVPLNMLRIRDPMWIHLERR